MNMRGLAAGLYALVAAAMVLGGAGLVVAPHREPPGTPRIHEHQVGALRFPILLLGEAPGVPAVTAETLSEHIRHLVPPDRPTLEQSHALALLVGGAILALIAVQIPRLPRPTRRALAKVAPVAVPVPQWQATLTTPPPRSPVFAA